MKKEESMHYGWIGIDNIVHDSEYNERYLSESFEYENVLNSEYNR